MTSYQKQLQQLMQSTFITTILQWFVQPEVLVQFSQTAVFGSVFAQPFSIM